ncbi:hypothetical protein EMCRGX_G027092 [Ephydatia muelleri]
MQEVTLVSGKSRHGGSEEDPPALQRLRRQASGRASKSSRPAGDAGQEELRRRVYKRRGAGRRARSG